MTKLNDRELFVANAKKMFGADKSTITRKEVLAVMKKYKMGQPHWLTMNKAFRVGRGEYVLSDHAPEPVNAETQKAWRKAQSKSVTVASTPVMTDVAMAAGLAPATSEISLIPERAKGYVPFGYYDDVRSIVRSGLFYPVYITGLSGNGKTMMIEQVHAEMKKEFIRVNVTIETDEDDLIGGFRLVDGRTVWQNGPVIVAMERGCSLLLDEVDLGSNKLMCLQPILEGKGIFLKKINKMVLPAPGFNVFATANTKGKGSEDGRFIGTNVLNEAFLERFSITMEQEYPSTKVETKILKNVMKAAGREDSNFVEMLVLWADIVRETFKNGGITEIISTRRLVHICQAYAIFNGDRMKSIQMCINRFDDDTKDSMLQLYKKVDETVNPPAPIVPNIKDKAADGAVVVEDIDSPF